MTETDIQGLIPEIYYDLIARIAAGVPVLLVVLFPTWANVDKLLGISTFLFLCGLGYVTGHILGALSSVINPLVWNRFLLRFAKKLRPLQYSFKSESAREIFDKMYARIDWVARKDKSGGAVLKKMEAGAALADNLFSGWLVILLYHAFGGKIVWDIKFSNLHDLFELLLLTVLLLVSVIVRRLIFIVRQDRMLKLLGYKEDDTL